MKGEPPSFSSHYPAVLRPHLAGPLLPGQLGFPQLGPSYAPPLPSLSTLVRPYSQNFPLSLPLDLPPLPGAGPPADSSSRKKGAQLPPVSPRLGEAPTYTFFCGLLPHLSAVFPEAWAASPCGPGWTRGRSTFLPRSPTLPSPPSVGPRSEGEVASKLARLSSKDSILSHLLAKGALPPSPRGFHEGSHPCAHAYLPWAQVWHCPERQLMLPMLAQLQGGK